MIVREIRFQSAAIEIGMTGWVLSVYLKPSLWGPLPHSKLLWNGTLISAATGFWSFFASSVCSSASSASALVPARALISVMASAAAMRVCMRTQCHRSVSFGATRFRAVPNNCSSLLAIMRRPTPRFTEPPNPAT